MRIIDDEWHSMNPEDRDVDRFLDQFFCFWETGGASSTARAIEFLKMVDREGGESIVSFSDSKKFSKLVNIQASLRWFRSLFTIIFRPSIWNVRSWKRS